MAVPVDSRMDGNGSRSSATARNCHPHTNRAFHAGKRQGDGKCTRETDEHMGRGATNDCLGFCRQVARGLILAYYDINRAAAQVRQRKVDPHGKRKMEKSQSSAKEPNPTICCRVFRWALFAALFMASIVGRHELPAVELFELLSACETGGNIVWLVWHI